MHTHFCRSSGNILFIDTFQDASGSLDSLQRLCTIEAQLSLLLRIGHNYGKHGSQILLSMGVLEHLASCKVLALQSKVPSVSCFIMYLSLALLRLESYREVQGWLVITKEKMIELGRLTRRSCLYLQF